MIHVLFSAFLFILSQFGWSCSVMAGIFWLAPLIMIAYQKSLSFKQGFMWGCIVFSFHLSWFLAMFLDHGVGWRGLIVWLIAVVWFSLSAGVWFLGTRYSFICSTVLFFLFLTRYSLIPLGRLEGYPLMHPVLPFINFVQKEQQTEGMIFIQPWWYGHANPMFVGYRMVESICQSVREHPDIHTIIMPESTFCFDMDEYSDFFPIWSDGCQEVNILFGGHRKSGHGYLNSIFWILSGKLVKVYDKQHFMPFVERAPWGLDLFGQKNKEAFAKFDDDIVKLGAQEYQLFVCSELFFEAKQLKGLPILMFWNDAWLQFDWTKRLAIRYIDYFAWKHKTFVLHASTLGIANIVLCKNHL
jgi:apolipoprotein N-acyltransferase